MTPNLSIDDNIIKEMFEAIVGASDKFDNISSHFKRGS